MYILVEQAELPTLVIWGYVLQCALHTSLWIENSVAIEIANQSITLMKLQ